MPIAVAVAGSSETSSAYVARSSRAIASWSQTYGITEDAIPTPTPAASATGSVRAGSASQPPIGVTTTRAISIDAARPSMPLTCSPCATRWPSTMYAAKRTAFASCERDAERLALEPDVGEEVDAADGERERRRVPPSSCAPRAARTMTGRNSIAATVPSGNRAIAR